MPMNHLTASRQFRRLCPATSPLLPRLVSTLALVALVPVLAIAQGLPFQQTLTGASAPGFTAAAVDGTTIVLGASGELVGGVKRGAAYVFENAGGIWTLRQTLTAPDGLLNDFFGAAVAVEGDSLAIGAPGVDVGPAVSVGAVYVFVRTGGTWTFDRRLLASDGTTGGFMGVSVAMSGTMIATGAIGTSAGHAYVFERTGGAFVEHRIGDLAFNPAGLGTAIDISGNTVCAGANGGVLVFARGPGGWALQGPSSGSGLVFTGAGAGVSCAVDGDTLVYGAPTTSLPGRGNEGAAHVYTRSGTTWAPQPLLVPSDVSGFGLADFGEAVAIHGNRIVVTAPLEEAGRAFVYERTGTAWTETERLNRPAGTGGFGFEVALGATGAVIPNNTQAWVFGTTSGGGNAAPGAPTNLQGSGQARVVSLSWGAPASGGAPTGYILRAWQGSVFLGSAPVGLTTAFSGAAPVGTYVLTVAAVNLVGEGPQSAPVVITVTDNGPVPGAPANFQATATGTTVHVSWAAPTSGGNVIRYVLLAGTTPNFTTPLGTLPLPSALSAYLLPGVPPGTYYLRMVAENSSGLGPASNEVAVVVAPLPAPGAPTLSAPLVSGNTVGLSWAPGGGGTPSSYVLTARTTGGTVIGTAPVSGTSVMVPNVPAGTYVLTLVAVNGAGASPSSNAVTVVVP